MFFESNLKKASKLAKQQQEASDSFAQSISKDLKGLACHFRFVSRSDERSLQIRATQGATRAKKRRMLMLSLCSDFLADFQLMSSASLLHNDSKFLPF